MSELLDRFRACPASPIYDQGDPNDRSREHHPWPGYARLPEGDRKVIAAVSAGGRKLAFINEGSTLHHVEGRAPYGYVVRTIALEPVPPSRATRQSRDRAVAPRVQTDQQTRRALSPLSSRLAAATAVSLAVGMIVVGLRVNQQLALIPPKLEALIEEAARQNADVRSVKAELTRRQTDAQESFPANDRIRLGARPLSTLSSPPTTNLFRPAGAGPSTKEMSP